MVIGLGPGSRQKVTAEAKKYLTGHYPVFFRTLKHPAARYFHRVNPGCSSFDHLYQQKGSFDEVYKTIVKRLLKAASRHKLVCYAVPGHPAVGEAAVGALRRLGPKLGVRIKIVEGLSFLGPVLLSLSLDLLDGVTVLDALKIEDLKEPSLRHLVISQVYSRRLASTVKLKLLELYPADFLVTLVNAAGTKKERSFLTSLSALDHRDIFSYDSTLYVPPAGRTSLGELTETMASLRGSPGCPWDKEQTHQSLRQYLVEEAYEVVGAIDGGRDRELVEELGDLLLQVVFHSQIAREENRFDLYDVLEKITAKMKRRHPHVFGARTAKDAAQVNLLWEEIKAGERKEKLPRDAIKVDHHLPGLLKAYKVQKKAAAKGFDWPTLEGPLGKATEELQELTEAVKANDKQQMEEELGDYLFTIVNMARFLGINPELALGKAIKKFVDRFDYIMENVHVSGRDIHDFSLDELDRWWEEAKKTGK